MTGVSASGLSAGRCYGLPAESPASPAAEPPRSDCQRWMWIELIGFDNQQADLGVADFLDNAGLVPAGLSLLFATADFVHTHRGLDQEVVFPPDYCSYGGKPYNMERNRQAWTNWQLKELVDRLRQRGIHVYFTLFNLYVSVIDGAAYRSPWCDSHPELMEYTRDGASAHCLSPIKRLADGSYYEDLLVKCVTSVARDYGFDGVHAADGYSSPRLPIWMADYSDDVVSQFTESMGIVLPDGIAPQTGAPTPSARIAVRADHIWKTLRREWCEFYARRFERLFEKVCRAMHGDGRQVILNNAWTRDPLEAYDRWGIDYRRLAGAGVDKFILETVGAGVSIGAESGFEADPRFDMNWMLACTKAALPDMPLLCLNATGDSTENWDVLNHAPPVSEREIATLGHMFLQDAEGFRHASAGPVVCLADGITRSQWRWLRENWQAAYERRPGRVLGATVVWSEAALEAEIADYPLRRVLTRHKIASELQRRGGPLQVVARIEHLDATRGCLLVPRPELLPPAELARVLEYPHGPVVTIGRQAATLPAPDLSFANGPGPDQLMCRVYHADRPVAVPEIPPSPEAELPDPIPDPPNYLYDLYFRPTSDAFLQACVQVLNELSAAPRLVSATPAARLLAFETPDGLVRLLVGNEAHIYVLARIDMRRPVREVRVASHFPGRPIEVSSSILHVRIPPRGVVLLDVTPM